MPISRLCHCSTHCACAGCCAHTQGYFTVRTPEELADALYQVSTYLSSSAAWVAYSFTVSPAIITLSDDLTAAGVVQLASRLNGSSLSLSTPLLVLGPLFPVLLDVPIPASVTLDLAGCIGCLSLKNDPMHGQVHVYLSDIQITGLEAAYSSSSNGSSGTLQGTPLALPLWAFQFNRSTCNASVILHNVTLTLPQVEFQLLLAGLPAAVGAGAGVPAAVGAGQGRGQDLEWGSSSHWPQELWWRSLACTWRCASTPPPKKLVPTLTDK